MQNISKNPNEIIRLFDKITGDIIGVVARNGQMIDLTQYKTMLYIVHDARGTEKPYLCILTENSKIKFAVILTNDEKDEFLKEHPPLNLVQSPQTLQ